jgi:hypothetical protein
MKFAGIFPRLNGARERRFTIRRTYAAGSARKDETGTVVRVETAQGRGFPA